jgi:phage replication O-like protein O
MTERISDRFIRLPTELLEALLHAPLSGTQWRIVGWVVRQTYGWNRHVAPFTWYRIAGDLSMDRGGVVRAGNRLLRSGILFAQGGGVGIQKNDAQWKRRMLAPQREEEGEMTGVSADGCPRKAMTGNIANDDERHRKRCQDTALFRRAKDSSKDRSKTYIEMHRDRAGAAKPVPSKYDGLSQN